MSKAKTASDIDNDLSELIHSLKDKNINMNTSVELNKAFNNVIRHNRSKIEYQKFMGNHEKIEYFEK